MPDSVQIKIDVDQRAKAIADALFSMPTWMLDRVAKTMKRENEYTVGHIQTRYLAFPMDGPTVPIGCRHISGLLQKSIWASEPRINGNTVTSTIGSPVKYAAAQEFGADIPAQTITAKNAKALAIPIGGRIIFRKSVNMPARHIEGRHFIQCGITDRLGDYNSSTSRAIVDSWNKNGK